MIQGRHDGIIQGWGQRQNKKQGQGYGQGRVSENIVGQGRERELGGRGGAVKKRYRSAGIWWWVALQTVGNHAEGEDVRSVLRSRCF